MDGRFYGSRIVEGGVRCPLGYGGVVERGARCPLGYGQAGVRSSAAERLDAADGVMDGRFYGSRIIEGGARYPAYSGYGYGYGTRALGASYYDAAPTYVRGAGYSAYPRPLTRYAGGSTAERLDAADGVMDGRFFGSRIVEGRGTPYASYGYPATYSGAYSYGPAARLDAADGVMDGRFFGSRIVEGPRSYPSYAPGYRSGAAETLDAADGVMDGRFYGRRIVEGSAPTQGARQAAAANLDAKDGVMDGKYFGSKVVA
eukprot:NODE_1665_length_1451_cov_423.370899_g1504_i0.p1 GENE.NODE_1665_length_1451_cov_423.370899_g1504_i0~~NODE_1665_length_1451_cov_423.370899_g1504_i0.p1  ORF type:complete len:258 (+),score=38.29 NODE_1665_length_1451_cov_423.370899_g1504_i0:526-1299(+)